MENMDIEPNNANDGADARALHARIEELFESVRSLPQAAREERIDAAAVSDEIRREVRSLLRYDREATPTIGGGARLSVDPKTLIGTRAGGFTIRSFLGSGGMGLVFEAEQDLPTRRVALKVLHESFTRPALLARFRRESEFLARLDHPNIARVIAAGTMRFGESDDHPYFAMELVEGGRAINRWASEARASHRDIARVFAEACDAVGHGHRRGVVHLDIKPGNLLVSSEGVARVIDYGIARSIGDGSADGTFVGTPQYMAPEQFRRAAGEPDSRSDVYSLGLVLYELLAGVLPYSTEGASTADAARIAEEAAIVDPRRLDSAIPAGLAAIAMKCLAHDREARYGTAAEIADDLRRWLAGDALVANPENSAQTLLRVICRYPIATTVIVLGLLATLGSAVVAGRSAVKANDAALLAHRESNRALQRAASAAARAGDPADAVRLLDRIDPAMRGWEARHLEASLARHELLALVRAEILRVSRIAATEEVACGITSGYVIVVDPKRPEPYELYDLRSFVRDGEKPYFNAITASPDGRTIFAALSGTQIVAIDRPTREIRLIDKNREIGWCRALETSLLVFNHEGFQMLDFTTGAPLMAPVEPMISVDFSISADNRSLLGSAPDGSLVMLDIDEAAHRISRRWSTPSRSQYSRAHAMAPDGSAAVVTWRDGAISLLRGTDGTTLLETDLPGGSVYDIAVTPDGRLAVASSWTSDLRVIDIDRLEIVDRIGTKSHIWDIDFDRAGTRVYGRCIVSASDWPMNLRDSEWLAAYSLEKSASQRDAAVGSDLTTANCAAGSHRVVGASRDGSLYEIDTRSGASRLVAKIDGLPRSIDNDRESLLVGFADGSVARLDRAADGTYAPRWRTPVFAGDASALAWSPDARHIACGGGSIACAMLDAESGAAVWKSELPQGRAGPDRRRVRRPLFLDRGATVTFFCTATHAQQPVFRVRDGATVGEYLREGGEGEWFAGLPGSDAMVAINMTGELLVYQRGQPVQYFPGSRNGGITATSPDGSRIVQAARDGTFRVFDTESKEELLQLELPAGYPIAISVDGGSDEISVLTSRGTLRTWSTRTPPASVPRPGRGQVEP
ncbi:MAG: WD40 repeat domain-containing serine/threonine protein kinase [Planctomycetaceae bacterium]|nr:WD40 repeat domain-containing serine/threonine protein kinase [Planctomycetaceae bacterium]